MEEALASRDARVARLEREAASLAERVLDRERRLQAALKRLGDSDEDGADLPGAITGLSKRLEDIHAQARRQATRIRMRALRDAVQIADRVTELAGLSEMLESSGLRPFAGIEESGNGNGATNGSPEGSFGKKPAGHVNGGVDGFFQGRVELEIGPVKDFAQLSQFEDAAAAIGPAGKIKVERFTGGRATISIELAEPVELLRELEQHAPLGFHVRSLHDDRVVLDLEADKSGKPDKAEAA